MGQESEVDLLNQNLPFVFEQQHLPADWNEEWILVPLDHPEDFDLPDDDLPMNMPSEPELGGGDMAEIGASLPTEVEGDFPGAFTRKWDLSSAPPPDYFAFYLPFHSFYPDWWGIYILHEGVQTLAQRFVVGSNGELQMHDCIEIARVFLFGHEQFHHNVESFASRLEVSNRIRMFRSGFKDVYRSTFGTDECLEEALANANAVRRVRDAMRKAKKPPRERAVADQVLKAYIAACPPGYRRGFDFVENDAFDNGRNQLAELSHRAALPTRRLSDPSVWGAFPRAFHPFRTRTGRVNYLVHEDSSFGRRLRLDPNVRYYRYREVVAQFKRLTGSELIRSNGSHHIFRTPSGRTFSVPRHTGDIGRGLLKTIIKHAGLHMTDMEFMQA